MAGQSKFQISGMPKTSVRQSEHRVRVAIDSGKFKFPFGRITINLSPADIPKDGGRFDLAIAMGILVSTGQVSGARLRDYEFYAELGLNGELRSIAGIIPSAMACFERGRTMILSTLDAPAAAQVGGLNILAASSLPELTAHLIGATKIAPYQPEPTPPADPEQTAAEESNLGDVLGQDCAKRALVVAAAGAHHMLMVGPPGAGKTMIAKCMPAILPPLTEREALEITAIYSISRESHIETHTSARAPRIVRSRPFRAPHHTISASALIGGGTTPVPGEISLAHHGVLFLDELTEFNRHVLDCMRQSLESGSVVISRVQGRALFPSRFQLLAAMNPCQCGYLGDPKRECGVCDRAQIVRYQSRISGPILDRLDLQVEVRKDSFLIPPTPMKWGADTAEVRRHVLLCRQRQYDRQGCPNSRLNTAAAKVHCCLKPALDKYFLLTCEHLGFSRRSHHRVLLVARTIADLYESLDIEEEHLKEAMTYRRIDRFRQLARS